MTPIGAISGCDNDDGHDGGIGSRGGIPPGRVIAYVRGATSMRLRILPLPYVSVLLSYRFHRRRFLHLSPQIFVQLLQGTRIRLIRTSARRTDIENRWLREKDVKR
ncbi:uncharacterized protein LOC111268425 [Varroa jacobsoni]|uniref:uncharacterized protein LOC111268425 n=1 Tax=Varroa jacobsoni TaxID=62625 RepID=UPI000BF73D93|nr:uncharacterized protein LOC111268425 [Varroa jacobsoni]